jgi:hypothetical protein
VQKAISYPRRFCFGFADEIRIAAEIASRRPRCCARTDLIVTHCEHSDHWRTWGRILHGPNRRMREEP